jgi:hypothetical protein
MDNFPCRYGGCKRRGVYDLFWDSYDDEGNPVEPDEYANWSKSCRYHIVELIRDHPFGPPVDYIILSSRPTVFLPKLADWANKKALSID